MSAENISAILFILFDISGL